MTPEEFAEAPRSAGVRGQGDHPIMDRKKHRVAVEGKGATDSFYIGFLDGIRQPHREQQNRHRHHVESGLLACARGEGRQS